MLKNKYNMSFTAGALLYRESLSVALLFEELGDWDTVRKQVHADNRLQMRTPKASRRIYREVAARLKHLTQLEFTLLCTGSPQEQHHLLWLATCKRYRFIHDFAIEVLHEKFVRRDLDLSYDAYAIFFNDKAEWYPEIDALAESTRKKLRQVLFKMMREANLLTADNQILPTLLTPRELEVITADSAAHLMLFPISPTEIQEYLQ